MYLLNASALLIILHGPSGFFTVVGRDRLEDRVKPQTISVDNSTMEKRETRTEQR